LAKSLPPTFKPRNVGVTRRRNPGTEPSLFLNTFGLQKKPPTNRLSGQPVAYSDKPFGSLRGNSSIRTRTTAKSAEIRNAVPVDRNTRNAQSNLKKAESTFEQVGAAANQIHITAQTIRTLLLKLAKLRGTKQDNPDIRTNVSRLASDIDTFAKDADNALRKAKESLVEARKSDRNRMPTYLVDTQRFMRIVLDNNKKAMESLQRAREMTSTIGTIKERRTRKRSRL
jgi:hypothetical protein